MPNGLNHNGFVALGSASTTWTPTITSTAGTITTVTGNTGRYYRSGKLVFFRLTATITTNGTGSGVVRATLPSLGNVAANYYFCTGREFGVSGKQLLGYMGSGSANCDIQNYDGTYPAANGAIIIVSGWYELV